MIKLSSSHTMVLDAEGTAHSFDLDALLLDLRRCFRECGMSEPWIADHIAMVVEEQVGAHSVDADAMPREADVHAMVVSLLCASGYEDVATHYREGNSLPLTTAQTRDARPWHRRRVETTLCRVLPLNDGERDRIVSRVTEALGQLGFTLVSTDLIEQLGIHAVAEEGGREHMAPRDRRQAWLMSAQAWPVAGCSETTRDSVAAGILTPYPVSRVLPRVRLRLDLVAAAGSAGRPPLTELAFLPAVNRMAAASAELLTRAVGHLRETQAAAAPMPPHLVVTGLDAAVADWVVPQCARSRKRLRDELMQIIEGQLECGCGRDVLITFK